MIGFALFVLAVIVGSYVYIARKVGKSVPAVSDVPTVPQPVADAPLADLAKPADPAV